MKRYESTLICLLLCLCMNAQEFEPKEYNGMLYQELASHVIDKEDAALVIYLHGRHARMDVTAKPDIRTVWRT